MLRYLLLYLFFISLLIVPAQAQEANGLGGYVPPPLFGAPNLPPDDHKPDDLGLPVISKEIVPVETEEKVIEETKPVAIKERIIKEAPAEKEVIKVIEPAPKPVEKPKAVPKPKLETPKKKEIIKKIEVKSGPEPIDLLDKKDIPKPPPIKNINEPEEPKFEAPKSTEGVVKGPKTMPSHKKQSVEAEVLFQSEEAKPVHIIERLNAPEKESGLEPLKSAEEVENIKNKMSLPSLDKQADGTKKLTMLYVEKQSDVKESQINALEQLIVPQLVKAPSAKLIINAFASSQDDSLNSARRLALSRALSVRDYLLHKKIEMNRIDVRALGADSNIQPLDRVELVIAP